MKRPPPTTTKKGAPDDGCVKGEGGGETDEVIEE